jgi:hypothetical protein
MSSRRMRLLPWAALRSDSEHYRSKIQKSLTDGLNNIDENENKSFDR